MAVAVVAGASMSRPCASTSALACAPQDSRNASRSCKVATTEAMFSLFYSFIFKMETNPNIRDPNPYSTHSQYLVFVCVCHEEYLPKVTNHKL